MQAPSARRHRRLARVRDAAFVLGASAFVIGVAAFSLSRSSLFGLRHVEITGRGHRSPAQVRATADLPYGTNVVWLNASAVTARLEADPWIARAVVRRSLPWSLSIDVTQRVPLAVLGDGPRGTYIAADGTKLGRARPTSALPRISLPTAPPSSSVGAPREGGAIRALRVMAPSLRHRVREVDVAVGGTLTLRLRGGTLVQLGPAVDLRAKAVVLRRILTWEQSSGTALGRISLVAPTAPAAVPSR